MDYITFLENKGFKNTLNVAFENKEYNILILENKILEELEISIKRNKKALPQSFKDSFKNAVKTAFENKEKELQKKIDYLFFEDEIDGFHRARLIQKYKVFSLKEYAEMFLKVLEKELL